MNALVLSFDTQGIGHCAYSEVIDLQTIGQLAVRRASVIKFNAKQQRWEVFDTKRHIIPCFKDESRAACLAWEQAHFNL